METFSKDGKRETCMGLFLILSSLLTLPKALLYGGIERITDMVPALAQSTDTVWAMELGQVSSLMAAMLYTTVLCSIAGGIGMLSQTEGAVKVALLGQITFFITSVWFLALGKSFLSMMLQFIISVFLIAYLSDLWLKNNSMVHIKAPLPKIKSKIHNSFHPTQKKRVA